MAARESDVYKEIKKAARSQLGGRVLKISDRHISGISDLYIVSPHYPSAWVEVKFLIAPKRTETMLTLDMTALQRTFLEEMQRCGAAGGWILCVKFPNSWRYYAGNDARVEKIDQRNWDVQRKRGESLNLTKLLEKIHGKVLVDDALPVEVKNGLVEG